MGMPDLSSGGSDLETDGCFCHPRVRLTMRVRELATANCARWQSIRCAPEAARVRPGWVARGARCLPRTQLAMTRMICTAGCDACRKSIAPLHRPGIRSNVLLSEMKYGALKTPTETTILPAQTRRRTSQWIPLCRIGTKTLRRTDVPHFHRLSRRTGSIWRGLDKSARAHQG